MSKWGCSSDSERDWEQRVQLALDLADRFQAALIGVAGLALRSPSQPEAL